MKYEYKILEFYEKGGEYPDIEVLNRLGNEGWELVSFVLEPYWKFIFKKTK